MEKSRSLGRTRYGFLSAVLVACIAGGLSYRALHRYEDKESSANYSMSFPGAPQGWKIMPHGPQTVFLYQQPGSKILLSGAINQVIDELNPTPDLGRDMLARQMLDVTRANLRGWSAEWMDTVGARGTSFRLIRRSQKGQVVVNAFAVRGNTTVLITMSGRDQHVQDVDGKLDQFRDFLSNVKLTRADLSKF